MNGRCCGRCKTPYNCGNPGCACHAEEMEIGPEWARAEAEHEAQDRMFREDLRSPDGRVTTLAYAATAEAKDRRNELDQRRRARTKRGL